MAGYNRPEYQIETCKVDDDCIYDGIKENLKDSVHTRYGFPSAVRHMLIWWNGMWRRWCTSEYCSRRLTSARFLSSSFTNLQAHA